MPNNKFCQLQNQLGIPETDDYIICQHNHMLLVQQNTSHSMTSNKIKVRQTILKMLQVINTLSKFMTKSSIQYLLKAFKFRCFIYCYLCFMDCYQMGLILVKLHTGISKRCCGPTCWNLQLSTGLFFPSICAPNT